MTKERVLIKDLKKYIDQEVFVSAWVETRRDHGKLIFLVLRDRTGIVQAVVHAAAGDVFNKVEELKDEYVVKMRVLVKKRPEKMIKEDEFNGDIELEIKEVEILARAENLPFEKDADLNIETHLDHLPLTLRKKQIHDVFKVQHTIINAFRKALQEKDFTEFQSPAIVGGDAEGGAGVFKVEYFKDKTAYLATSPQLYKQIMVGVFERVYTSGKVFRAEKHATTRHLSEYTSLDFEMGFIKDHTDVMEMLEYVTRKIVEEVHSKHKDIIENTELGLVKLPEGKYPAMTLREAQELIYKETGKDKRQEPDLEPEDERFLCEWARENHNSDFIFITHYPVSKRPFYTYEDENMPGYTKSFDLLFRGVEISTGGQRIHEYTKLVDNIKKWGLDPEKFQFYLQAFKYGIPPHGGIGMGLERLTAKIMGLKNVKEATLFPRDMTRIDLSLSKIEDNNAESK